MTPNNSRGLATAVFISFMITLAGIPKSALPAPSERRTISLDAIHVAFELPRGFTVFQWESYEGFYATTISFGGEFRLGHFKRVPFEIGFWPGPQDCPHNVPSSKPSECVDAEFQRVKENVRRRAPGYKSDPEYVKLFGNKAVRYTAYNPSRQTVIIGYLSESQLTKPLPGFNKEYLARITIFQDVPRAEFDTAYKALIDTVVNSLRVIR